MTDFKKLDEASKARDLEHWDLIICKHSPETDKVLLGGTMKVCETCKDVY